MFKNFILAPTVSKTVAVGDFVKVDADRGEDLGVVTEMISMHEFIERRYKNSVIVDDENFQIGFYFCYYFIIIIFIIYIIII
jgi:hypothetical protein